MTPPSTAGLEIVFLTDGGQAAEATAVRLLDFIAGARTTLDIAVYDAHFDDGLADRLIAALDDAERRGVRVRAIYNDLHRHHVVPPPPPEGPSLLQRLAAAVPSEAIPGIPDLMHHKYVVRDGDTVWTGSTNWTADSWSREENVIVTVDSAALAGRYLEDFEQLWKSQQVRHSGKVDTSPVAPGVATFHSQRPPGICRSTSAACSPCPRERCS